MKKITAKFKSNCAETGRQIKKGEIMLYDYSARKCYSENSTKFKEHETRPDDYVIDPGEIASDNFCMYNNI